MFERLSVMLMKEFLELKRDRWAMFRLIVPLLVQMLVFGYAATFTVHHVATAVLDLDQSRASRGLISRIVATSRFDVVDVARSSRQITHDINDGSATVAIVIHAGFARELADGQGAPLQVILDGTNSNTALIALGYLGQIVSQYSAQQASAVTLAPTLARAPPQGIRLETQPWFNEGLNDRWFFIPGVIGTLTLMQVVSLTAFAIVREREVGTLEQIMVSPIRPVEFILGKTVPFFLIGLGDIVLISILGILWFHVPFLGNPFVMLLNASLFLLATLGMGLLLSTFSRTQQQAFALNFFFVNPFFILSGFAFPIASMPKALQWFTLINPLRYFLVVIRAIFLKGVGLRALWP
ncbi:ABC transporter permease, partial [Acidiferrobacter sp.]|uniref:ABC transporter permease n=1 Tax=Acidiferrobacter sp. TaxID=1872107 RepID=UPI00261A1925